MPVELGPEETMRPSVADWRAVSDELAGVLQETMLRNPGLSAQGWDRAHAALRRYECAAEAMHSGPAAVPQAS